MFLESKTGFSDELFQCFEISLRILVLLLWLLIFLSTPKLSVVSIDDEVTFFFIISLFIIILLVCCFFIFFSILIICVLVWVLSFILVYLIFTAIFLLSIGFLFIFMSKVFLGVIFLVEVNLEAQRLEVFGAQVLEVKVGWRGDRLFAMELRQDIWLNHLNQTINY